LVLSFVKDVVLGLFQAESESPAVRAAVKAVVAALVAVAVAYVHTLALPF
jgi:hypothetical protein